MIVRGRDEPYSAIYTSDERVVVRVDFALQPSGWAEISISKEEIAQLHEGLQKQIRVELKDSEAVIIEQRGVGHSY